MISRLVRYQREILFAFRSGASFRDKILLSLRTIIFHFNNGFRRHPAIGEAHAYRLKIGAKCLPIKLRPSGGDLFIFYEILLDGSYYLPEATQPKRRGLNVVDLGANVGLTTLYYDMLFPGSSFFCVEPDRNNFDVLKHNISNIPQARAVQGAVGAQAGKGFFDSSGHSWGGKLANAGEEVTVWSIDDVIHESGFEHVDIMKIDIEGAEKEIFSSAPAWLKKTRLIIIELHDDYTLESFEKHIQPYGFEIIPANVAESQKMLVALRRV